MASCKVRGGFIEKAYALCSRVASIYLPFSLLRIGITGFDGGGVRGANASGLSNRHGLELLDQSRVGRA